MTKNIVILGAGTAGTMMSNHLRRALDKDWKITIIDQRTEHHYQPGYLFLPFGVYEPEDIVKPIEKFIPDGVNLKLGAIDKIYPEKDKVVMVSGEEFDYDILIVATVGNPAMHIPTLLGGLPGMEAMATSMMKKEMEKLDIPPIDEFLEILVASGVKIWACKLAMDMFHLEKEDLIDDLEGVLTVGDFYNRAHGEGSHLMFI